MDALTLARLQFGSTIIYHYFFVPLTLGLSILIAVMETLYVRTGNETYKRMAKFWGNLFLINFAVGVVTGIVQEFQFGMNWSAYSRFVGDVIGAPLAMEALMAFFMESTFLGIWVFGWDKLPKKVHLAMIWGVALASHLSALWILSTNAFLQEPVGYVLRNGRAEMTDFFAIIANPNLWVRYPHVVAGGLVTGAFFVAGISLFRLLKGSPDRDFFRRATQIGLIAALIGSLALIFSGDAQAKYLIREQPMKMAASEALWNSESPADLSLFSIIDEQNGTNVFAIRVPGALSFLSYNNFDGEVQGINELQAQFVEKYGPGTYVPPVMVTFWSFRIMVGAGMVMAMISLLGLWLLGKQRYERQRKLSWLVVGAIFLPYIANTAGWIMTEMGRQPWLVYGVLRTADGVSPTVSAEMVLFSLITFMVLYLILGVIDVYLMLKYSKTEPKGTGELPTEEKILLGSY